VSKYIRWQVALTVFGIVLVGAVLFYVSRDRPTPVPGLPTPSSKTETVSTRGGTYVEGLLGYPSYINPLFSDLNEVDRDLCALVFEGLTRVDEHNQIAPLLAERWEVSDDGLVYTFYLRTTVRWQDGEPLTAEDVLFTTSVLRSPDFPGLPFLAELWRSVDVEALDPHTVQFTLHEPYAPFLDYTTVGLIPKHLLEGVPVAELVQDPFNYQPVGTGLFRVAELTPEHVLLEVNRYHRQWEETHLDRVEFRFYPSFDALLAAYDAGEIMGIGRVQAHDLAQLRADPDSQLLSARLSGYSLIFVNLDNPDAPFFQDRRVRQALMYALDRQALVDQVLGGQGLVIHSPIMPASWAYKPDIKRYDHDPARAEELLERAGWTIEELDRLGLSDDGDQDAPVRTKNGDWLEFTLLTNDLPDRVALADAVAEQWRAIGALVHVQAVNMSDLAQNHLLPRDYDAALLQWQSTPPDPDPYPAWHSTQATGAGQNYSGFVNRDADEAIEVARLLADRGRRTELYHRFQDIFAEEVPAFVLYQPVYTFGISDRVRGVQIAPMYDPSGRFANISEWAVGMQELQLSDLNDQVGDTLDKDGLP
jgi:peptide/nickel transport system substrate-binding protein